jgi:hypothetical protein
MTMQAFYTDLFTHSAQENGLLSIARASLKKILAVRSELAWDQWGVS